MNEILKSPEEMQREAFNRLYTEPGQIPKFSWEDDYVALEKMAGGGTIYPVGADPITGFVPHIPGLNTPTQDVSYHPVLDAAQDINQTKPAELVPLAEAQPMPVVTPAPQPSVWVIPNPISPIPDIAVIPNEGLSGIPTLIPNPISPVSPLIVYPSDPTAPTAESSSWWPEIDMGGWQNTALAAAGIFAAALVASSFFRK